MEFSFLNSRVRAEAVREDVEDPGANEDNGMGKAVEIARKKDPLLIVQEVIDDIKKAFTSFNAQTLSSDIVAAVKNIVSPHPQRVCAERKGLASTLCVHNLLKIN